MMTSSTCSGFEPARLIDLFADSNISAGILRARGPQIAAALLGQDTGAATFDIDFMRKDMGDMLREAQSLGVSLPALAGTLQAFDQASKDGYGGIDGTRYPAYWLGHAVRRRETDPEVRVVSCQSAPPGGGPDGSSPP